MQHRGAGTLFVIVLQPVTLTTATLESEITNGYKIKESF